MTKPNSSGGGGGSSRPSRSGKPLPPAVNGGGKKPLRAVRALKQPDNSVLRPPLETSVAGLRQAVRLFETSTPEVVHLMSFECDIIYECRVCKNLFRSVANFISHKRIYCTRRFNHVQNSQVVEDHTLLMDGCDEPPQLTAPTRITARQDLTTIVQQASMAQYYRDAEDKVAQREQTRFDATVHLQPIDNTTYGVYQTYETPGAANAKSLMKDQVSELQNLMMMKEGVTLGPDGKILPNGSRLALEPDSSSSSSLVTPEKTPKAKQCPPSAHEEHTLSHHEHICGLCKIKFSSKKTLSHHTRNVHCSFRVAYTCPCCTNFFTNTWSVMRHLARVHRKTNDQVRRLRPQIQKKQVHAEKLLKKQGDASNKSSPTGSTSSSNNKRLAATPDKSELASSEVVKKGSTEVLRCAGCRRQFERQAAFQSHTQICHKRLALFGGGGGSGEKCGSSKMASPKPSNSSEKRIGIQLRVNYCKTGASPSPSPVATTSPKSRRSERHKNEAVAPCVDRRASLQLTPLSSRHSSKERLCENGSAPTSAPPSRPKIDTKLKTKKIESISRLLMEAIGGGGASNCLPIINGVKHCDNDDDHTNLVVPKQDNEAGDKCSRSSSCSASVAAGDSEKTRDADSRSSSGRVSRSRTGGRLSSADVSKAEDDPPPPPLMKELVVEVNGVHHEGDEAGGQLSPSKEGVIRVLTRYQLKSICKKDDVVVDEGGESEEVKSSEVDVEPEQLQVDRLREMFRTNILYKSLQCLVCLEKMKNIVELKNHVAEHFGCNHLRCTFAQCSFVTYARGECIRHVMRAHLKQNERHLAAGYIGKVDDKKADSEQENAIPKPNGSETLQKSSAVARRKRSLPLKKDSPPKNGGGGGNSVKQESADAAESDQTKAKSGNNAKKRKLNAEVGGDSSAAAPQATGNEPVQLPTVAGKERSGAAADGGGGAVVELPPPGLTGAASASGTTSTSSLRLLHSSSATQRKSK